MPQLPRAKWLAAPVVSLLLSLLGCTHPPCSCPAQAPVIHGLTIAVINFARSGSNVNFDFTATNETSTKQQFVWDQFVLKGPQDEHASYRPPGGAPYETITPRGSYSSSAVFRFPTFIPGEYAITYAGVWFEATAL
jgi:hypothetical protein